MTESDGGAVSDNMRSAYALKRFPQAPPKLPSLPYPWRCRKLVDDQHVWRNSVYYYWWEYMRRNTRYRLICELFDSADDSALRAEHSAGVTAAEIELYSHFGNIFATNFLSWWRTHYQLFTDEVSLLVSVRKSDAGEGELVATYPGAAVDRVTIGDMVRKAQFYHGENNAIVITHRVNRAKYRTAMRYVLPNLQAHLDVWDMARANPDMAHDEIADALNLAVSRDAHAHFLRDLIEDNLPHEEELKFVRRRKQLAVQRHLRIADQYIRNVMLGSFPLRQNR